MVLDHPELSAPPRFKFNLISSFKDALTRQISEAVRIERGRVEILNSKSEFNRCRIPRLRIDLEGWNIMKKKGVEQDGNKEQEISEADTGDKESDRMDEEILNRAEEVGRREETKRKQVDEDKIESGGRKKKKLKFDKVVSWGEESNSHVGEQGRMEDWVESMLPEDVPDVTRNWLLEVERTNINPVPELKQTSLDKVVKVLTNRKAGNPTNTGKTEKIKKTVFEFNMKGKLKQKEKHIQLVLKRKFDTTHPPPQNNI